MARTSRPLHIFPITLRELVVAEVRDLSPCMRRITLTGPQLQGWTTPDGLAMEPFRSLGFDDHVKLVIPDPDQPDADLGTQEATRFAWGPDVLRRSRDYTVRAFDPETGRLDIDLVRHEGGLAAEWAATATVGSRLHLAGPKTSAELVTDADWHLLVGDETALPAICRWLDEAPVDARAHIFVEVPTVADQQPLPSLSGVEVTWLVRCGEHRAGYSPLLAQAVAAFTPPPGRGFAWVAGETMTIKPIRQHLRGILPADDVEVDGYWRRVEQNADADSVAPIEVQMAVHEDVELGPALVLRTAAGLGLFDRLLERPRDLTGLAEALQLPAERLRPLMDALLALGYVRLDGTVFANTAKGEVLTDEHGEEAGLDHRQAP